MHGSFNRKVVFKTLMHEDSKKNGPDDKSLSNKHHKQN